jgi:GTP-binding protein
MSLPIRNVAVIAHVDHGKTTLVDALLKQSHVFRDNQLEMQENCILDRNALERERGITIMAKNCAIEYKGVKINIIDTPGHSDFSGEVERTLGMADGAVLIVDAQEGPMPQTRFVLKQAIKQHLKIIVVINKIEKKFARVDYVINKISDLFLELATDESHLDFPVLYAIGRQGVVYRQMPDNYEEPGTVIPLLDTILDVIPEPAHDTEKTFKMLVANIDADAHLGKIAIGRIAQGSIRVGQKIVLSQEPGQYLTVGNIMVYEGLNQKHVDYAEAGDIVSLTGIDKVGIGMTLTDALEPSALPSMEISEPTMHITVGPNTSPFSGKEGKFFTARQIEARLDRELENNVSLRLEKLSSGKFKVSGRGELHLSVLLENMRREGYELEVGKPEVITKRIDGIEHEPVEEVDVIVPNEYVGTINQEFGQRLADLIKMEPISDNEVEFIYHMPTRNILGFRTLLMTQTKGTVLFNSQILGFEPIGKILPKMRMGVIISDQTGKAVEYGLRNLKGRGVAFVIPGTDVYEGMIVGQNAKDDDIVMNVCKEKELTNHRKKGHQGITAMAPDVQMSLEESLDFLEPDELLEITPITLRFRKKFLTEIARRRADHPNSRS